MKEFSSPIAEEKVEKAMERGANVEIVARIMRHGERDKAGNLVDYGREVTRDAARASDEAGEPWDAVKALGSNVAPHNEAGAGRAKETAMIYADEIAEDGTLRTPRTRDILNYQTLVSKAPYDHVAVYNSFLPENYNELSDEEKSEAARFAQKKVVEHVWNLETEDAERYHKEIAGAYAVFILHYLEMTHRLKSGSRVLLPSGTHGGMMECLLREALVDAHGKSQWTLDEIGGDFNPSEGFVIKLSTDADGKESDIVLRFDENSPAGKSRPQGEFLLKKDRLEELADYYKTLHSKESL